MNDPLVVFLGPTLSRAEAEAILAGRYLPPAGAGDILSLLQAAQKPPAILLIDGCSRERQPVMHKEILYALELGVAVYGAGDVGALRAAEISPWGMIGHGIIFEGYSLGGLLDDDEVACAWSHNGNHFSRHSEPMVNVRRTVGRAAEEGVLSASEARRVEACAKDIFYRDRSWARILDGMSAELGPDRLSVFESWLPRGYVDQKREDALGLLRRVDEEGVLPPAPVEVERTPYFLAQLERERRVDRQAGTIAVDAIRLEAALHLQDYEELAFGALNREIVLMLADWIGLEASSAEVDTERRRLMDRHGLLDQQALDAWSAANDLDLAAADALFHEDALCRKLHRWLETARAPRRTTGPVLDAMRRANLYADWAEKAARRKAAAGADIARFTPDAAAELLAEHLRATGMTTSLPLDDWAAGRGLGDRLELILELADARAARSAGNGRDDGSSKR